MMTIICDLIFAKKINKQGKSVIQLTTTTAGHSASTDCSEQC